MLPTRERLCHPNRHGLSPSCAAVFLRINWNKAEIFFTMDEETLDEILDGHLRVSQKKKGYRFSLDSILLAHFVSLKPRTCAIDLGCGSGIILLILAKRFPHVNYTG